MREIKFRAWDDLNKKWLLGYELPNLGGFSLTGETVLFGEWGHCFDEFLFSRNGKTPDHLIIEQFSGFRDKNGKEVYEGDWIRVCSGYISKVIYDEKQCAFLSSYSHPEDPEDLLLCDLGNKVEVIGNIHEA